MKTNKTLIALLLCVLGGTAAAENSPSALLEEMERARGEAYVAARGRLLEHSPDALPTIEAKKRALDRARSWKSLALLDAVELWMKSPGRASRAYALGGLEPGVYLKRRRPVPEATRELSELDLGPILFEILFKTAEVYPFAGAEHYPARLGEDGRRDLREMERRALLEAVTIALGRSRHPAAAAALLEVAGTDARSLDLRATAAFALGLVGSSEAEARLISLHEDPSTPLEVRRGAIRGLGQIRSLASLEALASALRSEDADSRRAALRAIGSVAGPRALASVEPSPRSETEVESIRARASRAVVDAILLPGAGADADALVETIALIRHPSARTALLEARDRPEIDEASRRLIARAIRRLDRALARAR